MILFISNALSVLLLKSLLGLGRRLLLWSLIRFGGRVIGYWGPWLPPMCMRVGRSVVKSCILNTPLVAHPLSARLMALRLWHNVILFCSDCVRVALGGGLWGCERQWGGLWGSGTAARGFGACEVRGRPAVRAVGSAVGGI
jgi:hypothetical protein